MPLPRAAGTGKSVVVDRCQVCDSPDLIPSLFLGYLPPVNQMRPIGEPPHEQPSYPALLLACPHCHLVQLGLIVDPAILFPPEYPYTSGTTKILRDNFAELYREVKTLFPLRPEDLVVDIGSNDGTLLRNFLEGGHRVHGIEPTDMGKLARSRGIPTTIAFFSPTVASSFRAEHGPAKIITCTNVFAHMEDIGTLLEALIGMLDKDGVFISENHYLLSLLETLQYDTIYHEHLRYYSLHSLCYLLEAHGLEVFHARPIPTHGGSIRVYAARRGVYPVRESVTAILAEERKAGFGPERLTDFKNKVVLAKLQLYSLLHELKSAGARIVGIGAPSRASTLIHYVGLDDGILEAVLEIQGSHKIGKYMPGTIIPVEEESRLYANPQPDVALLLSWHIAEELMPKIRAKGFLGKFLIPLPVPRLVD